MTLQQTLQDGDGGILYDYSPASEIWVPGFKFQLY